MCGAHQFVNSRYNNGQQVAVARRGRDDAVREGRAFSL